MANLPPSTSHGFASAAGLKERYVREWLGGMLAGGLLEYDRESKTFGLPLEHAAFLTRAAGGDNMAALARYVAMLGDVEDEIVECFSRGGGVPYSRYAKVVMSDYENISEAADATLPERSLLAGSRDTIHRNRVSGLAARKRKPWASRTLASRTVTLRH